MKVLDPGHDYLLASLDGEAEQALTFVKRQGPGYPGNQGAHPGTTLQEVLRVLADRVQYVDRQVPAPENAAVLRHLREALVLLEQRAARRHGLELGAQPEAVERVPTCPICGHLACKHQGTAA